MTKQNFISKKKQSLNIPTQVKKRRRRRRRRRKFSLSPNLQSFLREHPYFSLDTPIIIDERDREWFEEQYKKDLSNMLKAVGFVDIRNLKKN